MKKIIIIASIVIVISIAFLVARSYLVPSIKVTAFDPGNKTATIRFGAKQVNLKAGVSSTIEGRNGYSMTAVLMGKQITGKLFKDKKEIMEILLDASI